MSCGNYLWNLFRSPLHNVLWNYLWNLFRSSLHNVLWKLFIEPLLLIIAQYVVETIYGTSTAYHCTICCGNYLWNLFCLSLHNMLWKLFMEPLPLIPSALLYRHKHLVESYMYSVNDSPFRRYTRYGCTCQHRPPGHCLYPGGGGRGYDSCDHWCRTLWCHHHPSRPLCVSVLGGGI